MEEMKGEHATEIKVENMEEVKVENMEEINVENVEAIKVEKMEVKKPKIHNRRFLSLKERIDVIRLAEAQCDTKELARRFECGRTQIIMILQQKDRLLKEWANNADPERLRRRPSAFAVAINKMVAEWINRARNAQIPLNDMIIADKATKAKKFFRYREFRPDKKWLDRFKIRFGIDNIDLATPDPSFGDGIEKSLKLSDIFEDIKESLDPALVRTIVNHQSSLEYKMFLMTESNLDETPVTSLKSQTICSNKEVSKIKIDDSKNLTRQLQKICQNEIKAEPTVPIKDDAQALECIKRQKEYYILKENFRAIGLIEQLEKLYKGQLEA